MPLSADDIRAAFAALSDELQREGTRAEIVVVGGAALVLLFHARESTKDVDAYFVKPEAMKLAAWRDAIDRADASLLLSQMSGSADEIWAATRPFVAAHLVDKASYAFEDLWEATRGRS